MQTILHGKSFLICDDLGDVTNGTTGLFARDTRHLSRLELRLDGRPPQDLGAPHGPHYCRTFFQRNLATESVPRDSLLLTREYLIDDEACYLRFTLTNLHPSTVTAPLELWLGADFDDVFVVKEQEFARLDDDTGEVGLGAGRPQRERRPRASGPALTIQGDGPESTCLSATQQPELGAHGQLVWRPTIEPGSDWTVDLRVSWRAIEAPLPKGRFDERRGRIDDEVRGWLRSTPTLGGGGVGLARTWEQSVQDLSALRIASEHEGQSMLPAAGMPWFMTVFGRDTAITCMQAMLLGPERSQPALDNLARLQATDDDPEADAEPGKILHEQREGGIADRGYSEYYGSIDSTPLFLILLDEAHRWTGDDGFVRRYRDTALRALEWLDRHGDRDGDGYLEYERRSSQGIRNQSWKDSWDSQRFADGRFAEGPIAPAEVQGYAYDARARMARLAEEVWGDDELARRLRDHAARLQRRFLDDFWVPADQVVPARDDDPRQGGYFALALDGNKQRVDALTSNVGHLLWSGIVDEQRTRAIARQLVHPVLANGWGVRTMSTLDAAYNPLAYHNGTVWPHDTSLCIAGLARAGHLREAGLLGRQLLEAAASFGGRLPEVFAGLDRGATAGVPVLYPTTCSPQAWAAAAPVLVVTELLGIEPVTARRELRARPQPIPDWLEGVSLTGIRAFGERWSVRVEAARVHVARG